jgi:hypothetical protein
MQPTAQFCVVSITLGEHLPRQGADGKPDADLATLFNR